MSCSRGLGIDIFIPVADFEGIFVNSDSSPNIEPRYAFCKLPSLFHSLEFDGPFQRCCLCERALLEGDGFQSPYFIERIFKGSEPIVEYALCFQCRSDQQERVSAESMKRIRAHWSSRVDESKRATEMVDGYLCGDLTIEDWTNQCVLTGQPLSECKSHQVVGLAFGHNLMLSALPVMISGAAMEEIQPLLSEETQGWMDDFVSDQFGMPPEFLDVPPVFI